MKTLNRILLSSTLFALLALFIILSLVVGIVYILSTSSQGTGFEWMEGDVVHAGQILEEAGTSDWKKLNDSLAEYGYNLYVQNSGGLVFSSLSVEQEAISYNLKRLNLDGRLLIGTVDNMSIAAKMNGVYSMYAIKGVPLEDDFWSGFMYPFIMICVVISAIILTLSHLFTRKMAWRVLRPLNALTRGANRIENGDFSQPIDYDGNDEFAHVCAAFNHMQEYLLKERQKNAAYETARTDMIAGISHDLRTPLTSVKGYIKGLRDGVANTPEKQEQYLSIAYQKACDMAVLLEKLFFFSKLETGNLPLSFKSQDLGDFVRQFAEDIQSELSEKGVALTVDVTTAPHPVQIDIEQMRRVLYNLVENSLHYAQADPLNLCISVWLEDDMEHLIFHDNGQGMPEDKLPHLFERFWRGDESRGVKNSDGSGLGMYIVSYIVQAHGGHVSARNDGGLAVQITLPYRKEDGHEQNTHR